MNFQNFSKLSKLIRMVSKIEVNTAEYKIPQIYLSTKYAKMLKSKNPRGFVIPTFKVQVTNLPDFDLSNFYLDSEADFAASTTAAPTTAKIHFTK